MQQDKQKVLFLDIETFPNLAYVWGLWEQNALSVEKHSIICAFSAKWLKGPQTSRVLADYKGKERESQLMDELHKLMNEADVIVAHNGDNFDLKKINTAFITLGFRPPAPYKTVDTLKIARSRFGFGSNRLNDLGQYLDLGEKIDNGGFKLWKGCMEEDPSAWKLMKKYNAQDVILLEKVYKRFLPWINNHPNAGMFTDKEVCPKCGSKKLHARGFAVNATTKYRRFQCLDCGGWGRGHVNLQSTKPIVNAK